MLFVKKIFEGKEDDIVHRKFVRFSVGEFERGLMSLRKGKDIKIKCSYDFVDDLFGLIAENCKGKVNVKGKIIASFDFGDDFEFVRYIKGKKFTGEVDFEVDCDKMKEIYEKFKLSFILLSVDCDGFKLKCKTSLPKPGKALDLKFCSAVFPKELVNEFVWEGDFKKAEIKHRVIVDEIVVPEGVSDFAEARKLSKRKGNVIRELVLDGKEIVKGKEFLV